MPNGRPATAQSGGAISMPRSRRGRPTPPMLVRWLYLLARWAKRRSAVHAPENLRRTTSDVNYRTWRRSELEQQLSRHFDRRLVAGQDVLDFGCGTGELCSLLAACNPRSVLGVDKSADAISHAASSVADTEVSGGCLPRFVCNERHSQLPLDDASVDLICCFDVVEHIPDVSAVIGEWHRVLRPRGRVWIWWSPWRGPYGHHLESLIPLPWVHLLLPGRVIFDTCAELYDDPDFIPRKWDLDPVTRRKKPNKWRHTRSFHPFLNRLTRREFERDVSRAGLVVERCETHGFGGSPLRRATRMLHPIPMLGEAFVSFYIYELVRG